MKILLTIFLAMLVSPTTLHGQDGSDILYVPNAELNNSYVGDFVHFDFYNKSFLRITLDTIMIQINDKSVRFVERRKDNGFTNWFHEQYIESVDKVDGYKIRIVKSKLNKITVDSVSVTNYLEYFIDDGMEKKKEIKCNYPRSIIATVLVSADRRK